VKASVAIYLKVSETSSTNWLSFDELSDEFSDELSDELSFRFGIDLGFLCYFFNLIEFL